ncbi:amidohydrolase [Ramlibacter rhizophilus]|uniref:Amidohydrolase n=1 Tax=Ramlibacter rhizophilus TaxID=1781167 RepID=A0A4Z0BHN6_9BURK|nr:amidohydrolase [Ramlibacter rhizophilus]TFY97418.1 amidohydrolase [Ramlibacter rhizophilus]
MSGVLRADRVLRGGRVITLAGGRIAQALALRGDTILAVGDDREVSSLCGPDTAIVELQGRSVMPGLIDGHAHVDREGLKGLLPSLSGCRSVAEVVERVRALAQDTPPGRWIVTLPLGEAPEFAVSPALFAEGRLPDRHDLDAATGAHPVLIRCAWGYWPPSLPTVSIANTAALRLAGIDRDTRSPSPKLQIETDAQGEPTGRFFEQAFQSLAEFTLFRQAPNFTADDRLRTLEASMRAYNAVGTTGVFEGHGVAGEVIDAWRASRAAGRSTLRAQLLVSPSFAGASLADAVQWVQREARRLRADAQGDDWLRLQGLFAEPLAEPTESRLRASAAPCTGWAGFNFDAGLPPEALRALLHAAACEGLRVAAIQSAMADVFLEVARETPIDGLRWVIAHPATLDARQVRGIADHGIVVTTHTNNYHWRSASALLARVGAARENEISPIRSLLDAGAVVSLATDNVPVSLWPCIWQACERIDRSTGQVIAPGQRITREEALRCATTHGAWLCGDEDRRGTLEAGKLADLIVLVDDPLSVSSERLPALAPQLTVVGGRTVWDAGASGR